MLQCLRCFVMLLEWVLRASLAIVQCSAFSVVDLSIWYDLPLDLRSLLVAHLANFYASLTFFDLLCIRRPTVL